MLRGEYEADASRAVLFILFYQKSPVGWIDIAGTGVETVGMALEAEAVVCQCGLEMDAVGGSRVDIAFTIRAVGHRHQQPFASQVLQGGGASLLEVDTGNIVDGPLFDTVVLHRDAQVVVLGV